MREARRFRRRRKRPAPPFYRPASALHSTVRCCGSVIRTTARFFPFSPKIRPAAPTTRLPPSSVTSTFSCASAMPRRRRQTRPGSRAGCGSPRANTYRARRRWADEQLADIRKPPRRRPRLHGRRRRAGGAESRLRGRRRGSRRRRGRRAPVSRHDRVQQVIRRARHPQVDQLVGRRAEVHPARLHRLCDRRRRAAPPVRRAFRIAAKGSGPAPASSSAARTASAGSAGRTGSAPRIGRPRRGAPALVRAAGPWEPRPPAAAPWKSRPAERSATRPPRLLRSYVAGSGFVHRLESPVPPASDA